MTNEELEAAKRICDAATPGPWFSVSSGSCQTMIATNDWKEHSHEDGKWICAGDIPDYGYQERDKSWPENESENFRFIAFARTALPKALRFAEAAIKLIEAIREEQCLGCLNRECPVNVAWREYAKL